MSDPLVVALVIGAGFATALLGWMAILKYRPKIPAWVGVGWRILAIAGALVLGIWSVTTGEPRGWILLAVVAMVALATAGRLIVSNFQNRDGARRAESNPSGTGTSA